MPQQLFRIKSLFTEFEAGSPDIPLRFQDLGHLFRLTHEGCDSAVVGVNGNGQRRWDLNIKV